MLGLIIAAWSVWRQAERLTTPVVLLAQELERTGLTPADLPPEWIDALVEVEDPNFSHHSGVDLRSPGAGWTTITQGLVKRHYPGPMRGLVGKPRQTILALFLGRELGKEAQLTLFLNTAYFGEPDGEAVLGFPAAAQRFYGAPFDVLDRQQFLGLVAMLVGPNTFDPLRHPETNRERVRRIEALLARRCSPDGWRDVYLRGCADAASGD